MEIIFIGIDGQEIAKGEGQAPRTMDIVELFTEGVQSTATSFQHIDDKTESYMAQSVKYRYYRDIKEGYTQPYKAHQAIVTLMPFNNKA